ncbi:MAG: hypothetical protein ACFFCO_09315, partial [Promethearchaeota archaeon]
DVPKSSGRSNSSTEEVKEWTAIGVTLRSKHRLIALKKAFEIQLGRGPVTWDFFFESILNNLGLLTWHFLIGQAVKGIKADEEPCPFPQTTREEVQKETG